MPHPNEQNLNTIYRVVRTRTSSGVVRESFVPSPSPFPYPHTPTTTHSNASAASLLTTASIAGRINPTASYRASASNVGPREIDKWVETGTIGSAATEGGLDGRRGEDGVALVDGEVESGLDEKREREDKKEMEMRMRKSGTELDPGQCWNCKSGPLVWAEEGDHFLVCGHCGEPS